MESSAKKNTRNRLLTLLISGGVALFVFVLYASNAFVSSENFVQALIYQIGYKVPEDDGQVIVVKKDHITSSLINKDPSRVDYASVFNLLGNEQKNDRLYKSRAQKFELFNLQLGFFRDIRNQLPINTSFDEWVNLVSGSENKDNNSEFFDQDSWYGSSRKVINYFKQNKSADGFVSFVKATGKAWNPKGANIFKVLAGGNDYLLIPTFCVDWSSEEVQQEVKKILANQFDDEEENEKVSTANSKNKKSKQSVKTLLERWTNLLENILYSEIVYDIKLLPQSKKQEGSSDSDFVFLSLSISLKTKGRDTSFVVEPAAVIGFDFVLQGEKESEADGLVVEALNKINSKVILAAHRKTEEFKESAAADEKEYAKLLNLTVDDDSNKLSENSKQVNLNDEAALANVLNTNTIKEDIAILPSEHFLENKKMVDYAMIDMAAGNKSYITEVPMIVPVSEKITENGALIATHTLYPSFSLRIALEKLDYDRTRSLQSDIKDCERKLLELNSGVADYNNQKEALLNKIEATKALLAETGYVDSMRSVFNSIANDFVTGKFNGPLCIKDLEIPVNYLGRLYLNFTGSTQKGKFKKAAISSVSFYECLEDGLLRQYSAKNANSTKLAPAFAHRRILTRDSRNKGGKAVIVGPFESTDFDFYPTPLSLNTMQYFQPHKEPLMGVEIHANAVDNILRRNFIKHPAPIATIISIVLGCLVTGLIMEAVSPLIGAILSLVMLYLAGWGSYFSYHSLSQVFHVVPLCVSIIITWLAYTLVNYVKQRAKAKTTKEMFSKFVAADVVQYMLDNPDLVRPGGTKTELTIFFSDVAGFTTISEGLSPEDLVVLLNEYLGAMTDLLFEYGGTLDKFIGDAVMAFWNFPKNQEDHAVRAVLCAIAMQKKIKELQIDWARRGFPKVAARCGINTQEVVVGYMGSQKAQMNFTCMGDGVNLASRLEGANKEYGTMMMVSENTYKKVNHAVRGRFLDFLAVKGKKEPVKVFELVCKIGDEPEGWFEKTEMYDKAIQLHLDRKWDEAIATFEDLLKKWPDDGPSKTYINRCKEYKENPPPEGWDGRYILTHK